MFCCCDLLDTELHCPVCGRVNLDCKVGIISEDDEDDYEPEDEDELEDT